jgi:hypothetical protein
VVIGGDDLVLEGPTSPDDWTVIAREFRQRWPDVLFIADDQAGQWFVWPDLATFSREFADDEVPHGFVHVLLSSDCLTLVVDDEETEARRVGIEVFETMRALRENRAG